MQDEYDQWSEPQERSTQGEAEPSDTPLDFDLACVRCGYNLRGTMPTGNCPECGEYVATTLRPDLLHQADTDWLGLLHKGSHWIVVAIIMNLAMIPIGIVIALAATASGGFQNQNPSALPIGATIILVAIGLVVTIVYGIGVWFITEAEPNRVTDHTSRSIARWLILPGMVIGIFPELITAVGTEAAILIGSLIDGLSSIIVLIGFLAGLLYLRTLANRIPEPSLAKQSMTVFWGYLVTMSAFIVLATGIAIFAFSMTSSSSTSGATTVMGVFGLLMCPLGLAMLVFLIWWIVLMFRYRTRFAQAHKISKREQRQARIENTEPFEM